LLAAASHHELLAIAIQIDLHVVIAAAASDDQVAADESRLNWIGSSRVGRDLTEQAVIFVVRPRGIVESRAAPGGGPVAKREAPQPVDHELMSGRLAQC